ncbi:hypothetical protein A0H81_10597 [Grifola frondosa]|uniref:FHA domain-containing protein n=1 Tax=Grifola frondosa TaxID=5627 RepID=A0A1C7LYW5_GRIFR|nr:hypothetical protein A0H81_10597 [Grifola frondosa]
MLREDGTCAQSGATRGSFSPASSCRAPVRYSPRRFSSCATHIFDLLQDTFSPSQNYVLHDACDVQDLDSHLWGSLQPTSPDSTSRRIDFLIGKKSYRIGRSRVGNDIVLDQNGTISNHHCSFLWDGLETVNSSVTLLDTSSNGTFFNGVLIGKGKSVQLQDGSKVALGAPSPDSEDTNCGRVYI